MTTPALLFTQCLQNDFVEPIGRFDPIPNRLHVGYSEALRLMGEVPAEGPVARTLRWAYGVPDEELRLIHIRDWHDPGDAGQGEHLERFGHHCIKGTPGAAFAFPPDRSSAKQVPIVDSLTLNDFQGTNLAEVLEPYAALPCRVGLIGVWTEAKIAFLAYELRTRYPSFQLAVCSALTASSSRHHHYEAIDLLERILRVRVFNSVGTFVDFLGGSDQETPLLGIKERHPEVEADFDLGETDRTLVRYLFRDCKSVQLEALDGGFSGNVVAGAESVDTRGHVQVPHVLKIGPQDQMGKERASFERIQEVMGNNAPHISDHADFGDRGAIKYRYASMGGTFSTTFQKQYMSGLPLDRVQRIVDVVFGEQLMRLYKAATLESCDLLEHYFFSDRWAESVREKVEQILGAPATERTVEVLPGVGVSNICDFYESTLSHLPARPGDQIYQAYTHGDLNGANIILDGHGNVWLIDFFHTRRAHVILDLVKLENDLLYIFTPVADEQALRQACRFTDALMAVSDLGVPLPEACPAEGEPFERAWATVRMLRAYYPELLHASRDPFQLWVGQMRYAVHTLGFDESDAHQKKWALYTAGRCAERITARLKSSTELRLDWLDEALTAPGKVALTLLPGRKDYRRDLDEDLARIAAGAVTHVLCLVSDAELDRYGVGGLREAYRDRGLQVHDLPILDQKVPSLEAMREAVGWMQSALVAGGSVLVHCVGGLGRSGMAAACLLRARGATYEEALAEVRRVRSPRAVETREQELFVRDYSPVLSVLSARRKGS